MVSVDVMHHVYLLLGSWLVSSSSQSRLHLCRINYVLVVVLYIHTYIDIYGFCLPSEVQCHSLILIQS